MKKSKKYMSEENFNLLVESLNQAIEYEHGERNDLRVTVVSALPRADSSSEAPEPTIREVINQELDGLSEANLKQVADYVAFLRFKERFAEPGLTVAHLLAGVTKENLRPEYE